MVEEGSIGVGEVIKITEENMTEAQFIGFMIGSIMKYIMRAQLKGNALQDYKKAQWYLDRLIKKMESKE